MEPRRTVPRMKARPLLLALAAGSFAFATEPRKAKAETRKAKAAAPAADPSATPWVEAAFPFFSSVVDARKAGPGLPEDNLTPRGLVLNLGQGCWVCFDPDLLRVAAVWRGAGVTPTALAPGSYHDISRKTPGGQAGLPTPSGSVWVAAGIYPGWQAGDVLSLDDPREPYTQLLVSSILPA